MASTRPAAPVREPMLEGLANLLSLRWSTWFRDLRADVDATPIQIVAPVQLTGQTASISTTAFETETLAAGLYSVSWYGQVVTPAGVSSSFQITIAWTRHGVTQTFTGALKNGNTTATNEPNGPLLFHIDAATPITYAVSYASNPAAAMVYDLDLVLQQVSQD